MVRPTTGLPSRTRSAATTELSTPPLMATAMGFVSGMHADSAQMGDARLDGLHERVDLFGGVGAAERETHAGAGAVVGESNGLQHVRWGERSAGAGRACGYRKPAQVE